MPNTQDPTPTTRHEAPTYHQDEQNELEHLQHSLEAKLRPQGALEHTVFDLLLHAARTLHRIHRLETRLSTDPLPGGQATTGLARHRARSLRSYNRALRELRILQTERALRAQLHPQLAATLPALASIREITKRTRTSPPPFSLRKFAGPLQ